MRYREGEVLVGRDFQRSGRVWRSGETVPRRLLKHWMDSFDRMVHKGLLVVVAGGVVAPSVPDAPPTDAPPADTAPVELSSPDAPPSAIVPASPSEAPVPSVHPARRLKRS